MKTSITLFLIFLSLFLLSPVYATPGAVDAGASKGQVKLDNPVPTVDPNILIGKVIQAVLGVVGSLALLMFVYGGYMWMLSAGNNERVQKGKDIIIWATLGLIIIFSSYAMVKFIFDGFGLGNGT